MIESLDSGRQEYTYDVWSNLISETSSVLREKNKEIRYEYDGLNRLIKIDYPDTEDVIYEYGSSEDDNHSAGKLIRIRDASGSLEYSYGKLGEVTMEKRSIKTHYGTENYDTSVMMYGSDYLGRMEYIVYPDGEKVTYSYDEGGQVTGVTGSHYDKDDFIYVKDIGYDEFGQRLYIEYGNGVKTEYKYDDARRWLSYIKTTGRWGAEFQNINYKFDNVGNVISYTNDCLSDSQGNYTTTQKYEYDSLYQLIHAEGETVYNPYSSVRPEYTSTYSQNFAFDAEGLGNMLSKQSSEIVTPQKLIGDDLNYKLDYNYDSRFAHRLINAGNRYYKYDSNGNIICEQDGGFDTVPELYSHPIKEESEDVYSTDYGWGLKGNVQNNSQISLPYKRTYTWNEKNQLIASIDSNYEVSYVYGQDGQRTNKYTQNSETVYFNKMWTLHIDSGNASFGGQYAKNIYLGDTRIVTKLNSRYSPSYQGECERQYFYHSDHLGSASLITDYAGNEYQRIEYTPYGETWVEKTSNIGNEYLPYKFTGKEIDEETGLYYYGARYLDPKYSLWISTDPALGDYIPAAGNGNSKNVGNLPGLGGVYNHINFHLYHYAGNNPVRYVDPDGKIIAVPIPIIPLPFPFVPNDNSYKKGGIILDDGIICFPHTTVFPNIDSDLKIKSTIFVGVTLSLFILGRHFINTSDIPSQGTVDGGIEGAPKVDAGKQGKHVEGHPNYKPDTGKSTWKNGASGIPETQQGWLEGEELQDGTRVWDSGKEIGANGQTGVRVHIDGKGNIHGYPVDPKQYLGE